MEGKLKPQKAEKAPQSRSVRQLSTALGASKLFVQKHQHTSSMPGFIPRKALSKSPIKSKISDDPLSNTGSFVLPEAATPPSHKRKRSLSASRRLEPMTPLSPELLQVISEECPHCEPLRQRERAIISVLSHLQYQLCLLVEAVTSWRAAQSTELSLPESDSDLGQQFVQDEVGRALSGVSREMKAVRMVLGELAKDVELLSRHAAWENVTIVKRKENSSKEALAGKLKDARSLLATLRQVCSVSKTPPPPISPADPLLVRSLKLQLQEVLREKLVLEMRLRGVSVAEDGERALRELVQEVQVS